MNILVLIKQVPDTEASIKLGGDQKSIAETGIKFIINPYDEFAIEEALRIKEARGGGSIKVMSLGPERAKEALRTAIAMGADDAMLLKSDGALVDGLAIARVLASQIKAGAFDLVLMGKEAIDDGNMQVGPMLAELLAVPCVTVVTRLTVEDGRIVAEREGDSGLEVLAAPLPCVVTCQKGLNEPRYPSIRGVMLAKKKEIAEQAVAPDGSRISVLSLTPPAARTGGKIVGEGAAAVPELVSLLHNDAKVI